MPKVTVIIPVFNGAAFVGRAIHSILEQTFQDFEIIVINDGSTDNTEEVVRDIADKRIRYFVQPNQGPNAARNNGIRQARGEQLAFLDADDWWLPVKLQAQLECLKERPEAGLVYCSALWIFLAGKVILQEALVEGDVIQPLLFKNLVTGSASSVMIPKRVFDKVGLFDEGFERMEDWEMWLRIGASFPFAAVRQPLVYITNLPDSNSKDFSNMHASHLAVLEKAFNSYARSFLYLQRDVLAAAYALGGRGFCKFGMYDLAREAFRKSLSLKSWNPELYANWVLTFCGPVINLQGLRLLHLLLEWRTRYKMQMRK
ncbi:MAG: glycosyltransferase family A protein [Candidatus Omnitrophota bacterium]